MEILEIQLHTIFLILIVSLSVAYYAGIISIPVQKSLLIETKTAPMSEDIANSSLFLLGIVRGTTSFLIPLLVSTDQSQNTPNADTWVSNGSKMGIQGFYEGGTYGITTDTPSYIRTITFVSPKSSIGDPIPKPSVGDKVMRTYLVTGETRMVLYTPDGPSDWLQKFKVIEDPAPTYEELRNKALGSLSDAGICQNCSKTQPPDTIR